MNEEEFINSIDCCFPYDNEEKWRSLIQQGIGISQNASYMVLHEICRKPHSVAVDKSTLFQMLDTWDTANNDSLKAHVLASARALIEDVEIPAAIVLDTLKKVSSF